jgi:hypothetical protein
MGWVINLTHRPLYPRERDPAPISCEGPRAALHECGKFCPPTGIRSPDLPARSEPLYRLSGPAHVEKSVCTSVDCKDARLAHYGNEREGSPEIDAVCRGRDIFPHCTASRPSVGPHPAVCPVGTEGVKLLELDAVIPNFTRVPKFAWPPQE